LSSRKEYCIGDLLADLKTGNLPIFKAIDNLSLPEKDEKEGGNLGGDKEFAVEETKAYYGDQEKSDDQRNQNISNQPVFHRNSNPKAISFTFEPVDSPKDPKPKCNSRNKLFMNAPLFNNL
jgi:hypothetical protein